VRARHDGVARNPWNEVECGNHYARSLASWGVLVAYTGAQWDARDRSLALDPAAAGDLTTFLSTGSGWGRASIDSRGVVITVDGGTIALDALTVRGRRMLGPDGSAGATIAAGESIRFTDQDDEQDQDSQEEPS
jgi:hypothetical protein